MRFWDSSALVPLFLEEPATPLVAQLHEDDLDLFAWWGSRIECASVIARLVREVKLDEDAAALARADLNTLFEEVNEIAPTDDVRLLAERCLAVHPLRAADALQLGAALVWARERPEGQVLAGKREPLRYGWRVRENVSVIRREESSV